MDDLELSNSNLSTSLSMLSFQKHGLHLIKSNGIQKVGYVIAWRDGQPLPDIKVDVDVTSKPSSTIYSFNDVN